MGEILLVFSLFIQVNNEKPIEGMTVSPKEGIVPVGGFTELQVSFFVFVSFDILIPAYLERFVWLVLYISLKF